MTLKVGFIGLGTMGKWMALNMMKAGFSLRVYDINPEAVHFLAGQGAVAAQSPSDLAAQVDWLFLSLPDTEIVEKVIFGANGVALGARPGLVLVDLSTISYIPTLEINRRLKEKGICFADAPVSGMEARAKEGKITVMFGGDDRLDSVYSFFQVPITVHNYIIEYFHFFDLILNSSPADFQVFVGLAAA